MLETSFGLNFFLKTPRNESPDGTRHIYMRITVNRQPRDIATKRVWHPSKWNIRRKGHSKQGKFQGIKQLLRLPQRKSFSG